MAGVRAVALSFGTGSLTSVYVYVPDFDRQIARATLQWRQGSGPYAEATDAVFPFDFTIVAQGSGDVEFRVAFEFKDGHRQNSPVGRVRLSN